VTEDESSLVTNTSMGSRPPDGAEFKVSHDVAIGPADIRPVVLTPAP
jgi:hypothetical protein